MKHGSSKRFVSAAAVVPLILVMSACGDQQEEEPIASTAGTTVTSPAPAPVITPDTMTAAPADTGASQPTQGQAGAAGSTAARPNAGGRSSNDAVFTAAQAERGQTNFQTYCTACHNGTEFRGSTFQQNWGGRTLADIHQFVSTNMPMDAPGSLTSQQYTDIISYFLRQNGYPAGSTELTQSALRDITVSPR